MIDELADLAADLDRLNRSRAFWAAQPAVFANGFSVEEQLAHLDAAIANTRRALAVLEARGA